MLLLLIYSISGHSENVDALKSSQFQFSNLQPERDRERESDIFTGKPLHIQTFNVESNSFYLVVPIPIMSIPKMLVECSLSRTSNACGLGNYSSFHFGLCRLCIVFVFRLKGILELWVNGCRAVGGD